MGGAAMTAKKKNSKKTRSKINWHAIREDYLVRNLDKKEGKTYTIVDLSKEWGVSAKQIHIHAKAGDWRGELRRRTQVISDARIEAHTDGLMEEQREIRKRHAMVAKGVIAKAGKKLGSIKKPEEELTVEQMVKMLAFGFTAEREAHGMPKFIQIQDVTQTDSERQYETPVMRMERRRIERLVDKDLAEAYTEHHNVGD